jgi:hypothetical protein
MTVTKKEIEKAMKAAQRIDQMDYPDDLSQEDRLTCVEEDMAIVNGVFFAQQEILSVESWEDSFEEYAFATDFGGEEWQKLMQLMFNKLQKVRGEKTVDVD